VYTAMGSGVPSKEGNFLTSWKAGRLASQEGHCSKQFLSYSVLEKSLQALFPLNTSFLSSTNKVYGLQF